MEQLRTALKITEKTVNELSHLIKTAAVVIVCQSADLKYSQDRFLSASQFSVFFVDRNSVTGHNGSTGAT
jgi:hypothetical protein